MQSSYKHQTALGRYVELPPLRLKTRLNFVKSNLHLPKGPHRIVKETICHPEDSIWYHIQKPIVRYPRPQDFHVSLKPYSKVQQCAGNNFKISRPVDKLFLRRKWTTTTEEATEELSRPILIVETPDTTLEKQVDPVKLQMKDKQFPMLWQNIGRRWDAIQIRSTTTRSFNVLDIDNPILNKENTERINYLKKMQSSRGESSHYKKKSLFLKPIPGYSGFMPRYPIAVNPLSDDECLMTSMCTTSQQTYRYIPNEEYKKLQYGHKGPLSMTITLTYPQTPFKGKG